MTSAAPADAGVTTASDIVGTLQRDDRLDLRPVDTTAKDCPAAGCAQSVTTDRFRIMSFATTGRAQRYAGDNALQQVESVVVDFAAAVAQPDRDRLWQQITQLVR